MRAVRNSPPVGRRKVCVPETTAAVRNLGIIGGGKYVFTVASSDKTRDEHLLERFQMSFEKKITIYVPIGVCEKGSVWVCY